MCFPSSRELVLYMRMSSLLEGICKTLDPNFKFVLVLRDILDKSNFRLPVYKEYSLWDIKDALYAFKDRINGRIVLNL